MLKRLAFLFLISGFVVAGFCGENIWTSGGPNGASIRSFTFHPINDDFIFANAETGLFRSLDGGRSWKRLDLIINEVALPGQSIITRIHPIRSATTIAAAGDTFFLSSDQGSTWNRIAKLKLARFEIISDLELDHENPDILYAAESRNSIFKSTNSGKKWFKINAGLPQASCSSLPDLQIHPDDPQILYYTCDGRLFKTANAGKLWSLIPTPERISKIAIDRVSPDTLYASFFDDLLKTTNGGKSWVAVNCGCSPLEGFSIDVKNPRVLIASGGGFSRNILRKTIDGGNSWFSLPSATFEKTANSISTGIHPRKNLIFAGGTPGPGIARSLNGGNRWIVSTKGLDDLAAMPSVSDESASNILALEGPPGNVFQSKNRGAFWTLLKSIIPGGIDPFLGVKDMQSHPRNKNLVIATLCCPSFGSSIAISNNGGKSWLFRISPLESSGQSITLDPQNQDTIYLFDVFKGVARSTDLGKNWTFINEGLRNLRVGFLKIDPRNSSQLYAGLSGERGFFKSTNAGESWTKINFPDFPGDIHFDPLDSRIIYVIGFPGGVYKSVDGAQTFIPKNNGLPLSNRGITSSINTFVIDPSNSQILYTGLNIFLPKSLDFRTQLFSSVNGGESWSPFDMKGLGIARVLSLKISAARPDTLIAGTNRGISLFTKSLDSSNPTAPRLDQISPIAGARDDIITLSGRNFGSSQGNSKVLFGNIDAGLAEFYSDSEIRISVPAGAETGSLSVIVNSERSNSFEFVVLGDAQNIDPPSGPGTGGTSVSIVLENDFTSSTVDVLFGSALAHSVRVAAPGVIVCTTPPGVGTVNVTVSSGLLSKVVGKFRFE